MALSQQKFREMVCQILYSQEISSNVDESIIELLMNELKISKRNVKLAVERSLSISEKNETLDSLISSVSLSYDFDRIQDVTKTILRIGVYELYFDEKIPPKVAIAEAIRLSRKFSTKESASFVNALLDHLYQKKLGHQIDQQTMQQSYDLLLESDQQASEIALEEPITPDAEDEDTNDNSPSAPLT